MLFQRKVSRAPKWRNKWMLGDILRSQEWHYVSPSVFSWLPSSELHQKWLEHNRPWTLLFPAPAPYLDMWRTRAHREPYLSGSGLGAYLCTCEVSTRVHSPLARCGVDRGRRSEGQRDQAPHPTWSILGSAAAPRTSALWHFYCVGSLYV